MNRNDMMPIIYVIADFSSAKTMGKIKKFLRLIRKILSSRVNLLLVFGISSGLTSISPDILTNPQIFCTYIGYIVLSVLMQLMDEWTQENKMAAIQKEIEELKWEIAKKN